MEKLIYLVERGAGTEESAAGVVLELARKELHRHCSRLSLDIWEPHRAVRLQAEHYATRDGTAQMVAAVSIWLDNLDDRGGFETTLRSLGLPTHGYLVTESMVRDYPTRDWFLGERSPGVTLVAAFKKPDRLTETEFYRFWQEGHSRLSVEIHPLSRYVRNAVARVLEPTAPRFAAIVEERVARVEDMDPAVFFAGRQREASADLARFVDVQLPGEIRIELMSEYIIRD